MGFVDSQFGTTETFDWVMKLVLKKWDIKSQNKLKYNQFNALMDTHKQTFRTNEETWAFNWEKD